ncbi:MAG TPA: molybdenum ABC transporter ATP-binding protein [Blastocatellia bacterium]|nr:molybdenum ABC transporter ATP-binding protein [Blastocatellia bacterium]
MLSVNIKKKIDDNANGFALDVEFTAPPGVTILFGASGSGKTMTLKSIAGIVRPDAGRIQVAGQTLFDAATGVDLPIRKRGVGYLFQNLALFPHLSVRENVEFGMAGLSRAERRRRSAAMMEAFRIGHTAERKPRDISGGEAQRAALARALSCQPRILLLDEPLSAIDEATKLGIIADLKALNRDLRLPIIYVTHSREEAVTLGERLIVYERGRVVAQGEPLEIFASPATISVARLTGVENLFDAVVLSQNQTGGTMRVEVADASGSCPLDVPFGRSSLGDRVKVAVPAGDILLATAEPRHTSARNILRGRILSIEDKGNRIVARVHSGVTWSVSLTRQAVADLQLAEGQEVWLAIKTHSCYLLDR